MPNQFVKIKWTGNNRKWYESKGYYFTSYNDYIEVDAKDLTHSNSAKILYICDYCDGVFTTSYAHYYERTFDGSPCACHKCSTQIKWDGSLLERQDYYYNRLVEKCKENGYLLKTPKDKIRNNNTYIVYTCPKHGDHKMKISNFLYGKKCPDCVPENNHKRFKLSVSDVIQRVNECGGHIINPEEYYNQDKQNLRFICPECGKEFISSLKHFQQHGGQVCADCSNYESFGEKKIRYFLENNHIDYIPQKWFPDCRDKYPLPFDFYIPDAKTIIEFDGQQHFFQSNLFPETLELIKKHDQIKNDYCKNNNIYLIRIPYTSINKVDSILEENIILHKDIVSSHAKA